MKYGGAWLFFLLAFLLSADLSALRAAFDSTGFGPTDVCRTLAEADVKTGYTIREEMWGGDLPDGGTKAISQQLFKGNEYHFHLYANVKAAKVSVHIYDQDGNLAEADSWQKGAKEGSSAGASVKPGRTGTYFLIVKIEKSSEERTPWGMVYAYK